MVGQSPTVLVLNAQTGVKEPDSTIGVAGGGESRNAAHDSQVGGSGTELETTGREQFDSGTETFGVPSQPRPRKTSRSTFWCLIFMLQCFLAILLVALYSFPFVTIAVLVSIFVWSLYICGEEPVIKMVTAKMLSGGPLRKKVLRRLTGALTWIKGLRSSHDKEHKLQAILHSLCLCTILFNPDVGAISALCDSFEPFQALMVLASVVLFMTCIAHMIVKRVHERRFKRGSGHYSSGGGPLVQKVMADIRQSLYRSKGRRGRLIINILSGMDKSLLSELIERMHESPDCSLVRVFSQVRDMSEQPFRSDLINLLCDNSMHLSVKAKSILLHALMQTRLSSCVSAEEAVEKLLTSTFGDDLSELKSMQDSLGDIQSTHKLIFQDLTDEAIRERILDHFLAEGLVQVAHRTLMASGHFKHIIGLGEKRRCVPEQLRFLCQNTQNGKVEGNSYSGRLCGHAWLKILTDMDDTLVSSGGRFPAGIDTRYARHTPYPGVTAFYRELQGGGNVGQLVALSARPHIVNDIMERGVFKKFQILQANHGLHTMPGLLTGSIDAGSRFLLSGGDEDGVRALGQKKFDSFREFVRLYPEFQMVFIGDNGQADYAVGQMLCHHFPHNVQQVYIHKVQAEDKTFGYKPDADVPIDFFDDYVMCAVKAACRRPPLISPQGLRNVVDAALEDFRKIPTWIKDGDRDAEATRLNQSVLRAQEVMRQLCVDDELDLLEVVQPAGPPADSTASKTSLPASEDIGEKDVVSDRGILSFLKGRSTSTAEEKVAQKEHVSPKLEPANPTERPTLFGIPIPSRTPTLKAQPPPAPPLANLTDGERGCQGDSLPFLSLNNPGDLQFALDMEDGADLSPPEARKPPVLISPRERFTSGAMSLLGFPRVFASSASPKVDGNLVVPGTEPPVVAEEVHTADGTLTHEAQPSVRLGLPARFRVNHCEPCPTPPVAHEEVLEDQNDPGTPSSLPTRSPTVVSVPTSAPNTPRGQEERGHEVAVGGGRGAQGTTFMGIVSGLANWTASQQNKDQSSSQSPRVPGDAPPQNEAAPSPLPFTPSFAQVSAIAIVGGDDSPTSHQAEDDELHPMLEPSSAKTPP